MNIWKTLADAYQGYASYLWQEITHPSWHNYFYWLLLVSLFFFALEVVVPWRKQQSKIRKDFWLDFFYMFFNFFLFSLVVYNAASTIVVDFFNDTILNLTGFNLQASNPMRFWPAWAILIAGFLVRDFVQWWVHRLLHRSPMLWEFHKVHHSVEQMGFAAHLRYHWMETIVYRSIEYIPLALMGVGLYDFFVIHIFTLAVGHYNHSNITVPGTVTGGVLGGLIGIAIATGAYDIQLLSDPVWFTQLLVFLACVGAGALLMGPVMKRVFNSPEMHIWHHTYDLPEDKPYGVNYGITLALWDYLFQTAYVPRSGRDNRLGFPGVEKFPTSFWQQITYGFSSGKKEGSEKKKEIHA